MLRERDPGVSISQGAPVLLNYYGTVSTVLGGCCANVWTYEQLLKINPRIGSALTFAQMLFIAIAFFDFSSLPRLPPRQIPLRQWGYQVVLLASATLLNNWSYAYKVPLTVQIVFRSAGLPVSMLFGYLFLRRRYSFLQQVAVVLVSFGVLVATLSQPLGNSSLTQSVAVKPRSLDPGTYAIGISMLVGSCLLYAGLGLMQERAYRNYGPCWREGVFYTHFLSLPIFLFLISDVKQGLYSLSATSSLSRHSSYLIMASNLLSQLICVSSVNRLMSQVSSVSTNLVLTTRKVISLCFSVWYFGNPWNTKLLVGAGMVFTGSLLFTHSPEIVAKDKQE